MRSKIFLSCLDISEKSAAMNSGTHITMEKITGVFIEAKF
jgi:hypothetical protein